MGERADEYEFLRVGSADEKLGVERELAELKERLEQVDEWKRRRDEINDELKGVRRADGEKVEAPEYLREQEGEVVEAEAETEGNGDV